jgi:hypothetical protein
MTKRLATAALGLLLATCGAGADAPAARDPWIKIDSATAACHYLPNPVELTLSMPQGYVSRDPKHGPVIGCFWGTKEDLDRVLASGKGADFGKLQKGVFQVHLSTSSAYDPRTGKFADESQMLKGLEGSGYTGSKVTPRQFGKYSGRVLTGKAKNGLDLYLLYLAPGLGTNVLVINYHSATPPSPADNAVWVRFLDSIQPKK